MHPLLKIESLCFTYTTPAAPVFRELNLSVDEGELVLIKGGSGTGKSTLLRLVCRLLPYQEGRILFRGRSIESVVPAELRRAIVYVAQIPSMTEASVRDNLLLPFSFAVNHDMVQPSEKKLEQMLEQFYLTDVALNHQARNMSVGQQQRIALMRALLLDPEILLLDEPTSALDEKSSSMIFSIIERLSAKEGKTILMVTHSNFTPQDVSPRSYVLENRKLRKV